MRPGRIREDDAKGLLALLERLDAETRFMMYEPGERETTVDQQRASIKQALKKGGRITLVLEDDDRLVGFLHAERGSFERNRHGARIAIGILQAYAGRGLGTALMEEAER